MIGRIHSRAVVACATLLLIAAFSSGIQAQVSGPDKRGRIGRGGLDRGTLGLAELDLTDPQREQMRAVRQRYQDQMQEAGKRLHDAHDAQRAAVETLPVNEALIRSTTQTLANAQTDMALLRARIHADIWSLLTPDQQEKAKQLRASREARSKQRLQRRRSRQQG